MKYYERIGKIIKSLFGLNQMQTKPEKDKVGGLENEIQRLVDKLALFKSIHRGNRDEMYEVENLLKKRSREYRELTGNHFITRYQEI